MLTFRLYTFTPLSNLLSLTFPINFFPSLSMQAYEAPPAKYFATPPVQLIYAYHASLTAITKDKSLSLSDRFEKHKAVSNKVKDTVESWGLGSVPLSRECAANGMSAVKFPEGMKAGDL
jgi:alanine-glyoxylate transaminase/serine-glyoxylate transaminase/serine-pyruvate transaminase